MAVKIKTRNDILKQLLRETEDDKITWTIDDINNEYIKAVYILALTPKKRLINKIVYFLNKPKKTILSINMEIKDTGFMNAGTSIIPVMSFGASMRWERKIILDLLNKILLKEEEREKTSKNQEIQN